MTRDEWLEQRKTGLGASDVPAALGFSPWRTPLEVWLAKTSNPLAPSAEPSDIMQWGLDVENGIAGAYERMTGRRVVRNYDYHIIHHPQYPELFCTPDGWTNEPEPRLVQLKWSRRQDGWGDPGTDQIPDLYAIQIACEMACTGISLEDVAAMIVGPPVLVYPFRRDLEFEHEVIDAARAWYSDYVLKNVEPPVTGTQPWGSYLARKFPRNTGEWLEAGELGDPVREEVEQFLQARREAQEAAEAEEEWKNRLKARIADGDGIRWKGGQISWRKDKDHREDVTDWNGIFLELCTKFNISVSAQQLLKETYTQFGVVTREGRRKFVVREDQ